MTADTATSDLARQGAVPGSLWVIANVRGSRRRLRYARVMEAIRGLGADIVVHRVEAPGDAKRHAAAARVAWLAGTGPDRLIVAGGDGSMNDVINGLAGAGLPTGFLPLGSANVLAQELALPRDPAALARILLFGPVVEACLGRANGRLFLLMAGVGLDAEVCDRIHRPLKRYIRQGAYVLTTISRWLAYRSRRYRVTVDGQMFEVASALICNARHYGGPFISAPDADITKPVLHVCLFGVSGRFRAIAYMAGMFLGTLHGMAGFRIVPGTHITVEAEPGHQGRDPVQGDGDTIAELPVEITVAEERLQLIVPG
ncbi:MAG: diacylglycerol kinase family lipid kinase [Alphaproteobacteria bacterium]|nr:diacylglycerol kinase family lipid kinase [Alphaproteobacteria bacterium]